MTTPTKTVDEILDESPIDKEVPDDVWETIYPTFTGLWTDSYGEWDEKQLSDIYPISDLLSTQARDRLKQSLRTIVEDAFDEVIGEDINVLYELTASELVIARAKNAEKSEARQRAKAKLTEMFREE